MEPRWWCGSSLAFSWMFLVIAADSVYEWHAAENGKVPGCALIAGVEKNRVSYTGRAVYDGQVLPAKVFPGEWAWVYWKKKDGNYVQFQVKEYEVLCSGDAIWVPGSQGSVSPGSFSSGQTTLGEQLYTCRVYHEGTLQPGMLQPSKGLCYFGYNGEKWNKEYEVLQFRTQREPYEWRVASAGKVPANALIVGSEQGRSSYAGRAFHDGNMLPGKVFKGEWAWVYWNGTQHTKEKYEVLLAERVIWWPAADGKVPAGSLVTGITSKGENLYTCRAYHEGTLQPGMLRPNYKVCFIGFNGLKVYSEYEVLRIDSSPPAYSWRSAKGGVVPFDALVAGEENWRVSYAGRAFFQDHILPAKVFKGERAWVYWNDTQHLVEHYEVLVAPNVTWVAASKGVVPTGSLQTGQTANGEKLYTCRTFYDGTLQPGMLQPSRKLCFIGFNGLKTNDKYEVLTVNPTPEPCQKERTCREGACDAETGICSRRRQFVFGNACGVAPRSSALVANGQPAPISYFPWHAAVYIKDEDPEKYIYICGASLVSAKILVSAAHCFYNARYDPPVNPAENFAVALGKVYSKWTAKEKGQIHKSDVAAIFIPDSFRSHATNLALDIAMVVLKDAVPPSNTLKPVCVDDTVHLSIGENMQVAGWGAGYAPLEELAFIDIPHTPVSDCVRQSSNNFARFITADKFCSILKGEKGLQKGDSGGAAIVERNGLWFLQGIVSIRDEEKTTYAFTNVSFEHNLLWMREMKRRLKL